jgi:hypothetical protein
MKQRAVLVLTASLGLLALALNGCAGVRTAEGTYVAHGTALTIFGFDIPDDSLKLANDKVPSSATSKQTIAASARDWTSFWGILNSILSFNSATIGGEMTGGDMGAPAME